MALKYCPECGNKLPEKAKFCPDCGYKLEIPDETPITPEPEVIEPEVVEEPEITQSRPPIDMVEVSEVKPCRVKHRKPLYVFLGVLLVIFVLLICVYLIMVLDNKNESTTSTQAVIESVVSTEAIKETEIDFLLKNDESIKLDSLTLHNVKMWIPNGYVVNESGDTVVFENDYVQCGVVIGNRSDLQYAGIDDIQPYLIDYVDDYISSMPTKLPDIQLLEIFDTVVNTTDDYVEIDKRAKCVDNTRPLSIRIKVIYRQGYDQTVIMMSAYWDEPTDYIKVEDKILNSIEILENSTSTTPSSGVSTEVKEFVDGFESFFNKYVDVMKSIGKGSSDLSVLGEYATLLSEYADWMNKIEEFESKDMTAEDSKYFWDAYARVMNNLTSAGLSDN